MKINGFIVIALFVIIVGAFASAKISSENYGITSPITSSGGGQTESGNFILRTVLGIISGVMESLNFQTSLGFFYGIDTTAPKVEILYPVEGVTYYSYVGDINYTVDVGTHCWYQKNSNPISSAVLLGVNWTNVYENSVIGSNTWTVFCNDSAGNVGSDSVNFNVDNVVPNIYFSGDTPDNEEVLSQSYFTVNVTSSDSSGEHSTFVDFDDSLVGWWKLENNYLDSSGNNNHGSCTSCPKVMGGKRGLGFEFEVYPNSIEIPYGNGVNVSEFSVSMWVKPNSVSGNPIFFASDNGASQRLYLSIYGGKWDIGIQGSAWSTSLSQTIATTDWTYVTLIMNDNLAELYINGVFSMSKSYTSYLLASDFRIGRHRTDSSTYQFNGSIDDVMIFDRALSESEVKSLYNAQNNQYGNVFDGLGNRVYNFTAYSQDKAGNVNSTSRSVEVNMAPGDVNVSILYDKPLNSRRGSLNVSWEDTSDGEDSFSIERSLDNSSFSEINTVSGVSGIGSVVSYVDSDLDDNKVYYYRVRSYAGGLYSGYSSVGANNTADRRGEYSPILNLTSDSTNNKIDLRVSEGDPNLVLYLPFEEGQGILTSDWSLSNKDGIINGATWTTGKQGNGRALSFDGIDDYVNLSKLNSQNNAPISFSAWIKWNGQTSPVSGIWGTTGGNNLNSHFEIQSNGMRLRIGNTNKGGMPSPPANEWAYVSFVYSGGFTKYYINGIEVDSFSGTTGEIFTGDIHRIGLSDSGRPFQGNIDEVRVYNKALTQEEIINDMQSGLVRKGLYRNDSENSFVPIGGVYDDFSDSILNNYYQSFAAVSSSPSLTTWSVSNNILKASNSGNKYGTLIYKHSIVSDFIVEVDINTSATHAGIVWAIPSITEATKGYQWVIRDYANNNRIQKWDSSQTYLCEHGIENLPSWFNNNEWYHLKLVVEGKNVKTYINDFLTLDCSHEDNSFGLGYVGLTNYDSVTNFKNFKVTPLISSNEYNDIEAVDLEKPDNVTGLGSSTHVLSTWTNVNNLNINWVDANDFGTSYSYYSKSYDSSGNEDNLFKDNPYFETSSTSGWSLSNAVGGNWKITNDSAYEGNYSLYTPVASSGDQYAHMSRNFGENIAGRKFKISAYVKTKGISANNLGFKTYWKNSAGSWIWENQVSSNSVGGNSDWTKLEAVSVAPESAYYSTIIIFPITKNGQGEFWVDSVSLVEIKNATITSGVEGYATSLTDGANEIEGEIKDVDVNVRSKLFSNVGTGQNWFFNIRSKDRAGNWANPNQTASYGPFWICNDASGIVDSDGDDASGFINLTDSGNTCGCSASDVLNSRRCSTTYDGIETGICIAVGVCDEPVINVTLIEPAHGDYVANKAIFECDVSSNSQLNNVSLFTSFGGWNSKANTNISGLFGNGYWLIQNMNTQGNFIWNCLACDVNNYCESAELNRTFSIDLTNPNINFISPTPNNSSARSEQTIVVNISSSDNYGEHSTFVDFNNSLVGWWRFDNNFDDSSVYDNDGTCSNCPTLTNGPRGLAYEFDGVNDVIELGDILDMGLENMSISVWVKKDSVPTSTNYIISKAKAASQDHRYGVSIRTTGAPGIFMQGNTPGSDFSLDGGINICDNNWHLLTFVFNRNENALIYVDGLYRAGKSISHWSSVDMQSNNPFRIGSYTASDNITPSSFFNGSIDDVMVFNRTLSEGEIKSLYNAQANQYVNSFNNLEDGFYSFRGYAQDMAGNINLTEERIVEINNEPPEIEIFSPENITYAYGEGIWFNISASHEKGISSCWFNLNNTKNITLNFIGGTNYSYLNESMFSGYYLANFQCNNTLGVLSEIANVNFTINSLPTVELIYPIGGENITNRTPEFSWQGNDIDGDSLTYEIIIEEHKSGGGAICFDNYEEPILEDYFIPFQDLKCLSDYGYYYTWKVRAHDGMNWGPYSSEEDFYVNALIMVSLPNDEISFGSLDYLASNDTSDDSPMPLIIKNDGNVKINISASASPMWDVQTNDSEYYKVKVDNRSGFPNAFKWISSAFEWINMGITGQVFLIDSLEYHDNKDSAEIDIYLEVPPNEGPGLKNSTIVFESKLAELEA